MEEPTAIIMASLSILSPAHLSYLSLTIFSNLRHHNHRVYTLVSSPTLFFLTLHRLHSLSLCHKTHLIARYLLDSLHHITALHNFQNYPQPIHPSTSLNQRDLDSVLLLLLLCKFNQHNPDALGTQPLKWRSILCKFYVESMLAVSGIGFNLVPYIQMITRCLRFVKVMGYWSYEESASKIEREMAASVATVVALPSVEVKKSGVVECVMCKEEMEEGREVCELPCKHLFHWVCVLPWFRKRNTCPCCRFQLPTDDVFGEIQRLWKILVKMGKKV